MLEGRKLARQEENLRILNSVTLQVPKGKITGVLSLDERETSTLLQVLSGHLASSSGQVLLNEKALEPDPNRGFSPLGVSLIPGTKRLFPNLSVFDNLMITLTGRFGGEKHRYKLDKGMSVILPMLQQFNFQPSPDTHVRLLTWEELQKVAVIQCLLEESDYLLIEQITSALPLGAIEHFFNELRTRRDAGCGILFVPDNPNQLFALCDDVVILRNGVNVFKRSVSEVEVEEIYNILNNTEYTVNQAIENKFHQFNSSLNSMENLLTRSLKVLGNFCALYQSFSIYQDGQAWSVVASKYWNPKYKLCPPDQAPKLAQQIAALNASEGFVGHDGTTWYFSVASNQAGAQVYVLMRCDEEPEYPLQRILRELRASIGLLIDKLRQEAAAKKREVEAIRLSQEMNIAKNIQSSILPKILDIPGYQVAASMETATEVGGDAYEVLPTPLGNFIGIGDVSGHGLPSGIMALIETSAFHGAVQAHMSMGVRAEPDRIYDIVNRVLCTLNRDRIGSDKFMTKILMLEQDGDFVHAGTHLIGLCYKAGEKKVLQLKDMIDRTAFLGISEHIQSSTSISRFHLEKGDILLLYTDGLIEAKNEQSDLFGIERLEKVFQQEIQTPLPELLVKLRNAAHEFALEGDIKKNQGHFEDDVTMVIMKRL